MSKRSWISNITPLPPTVSREAALALLHNHAEMIELNPLVLRHQRTQAPKNATLEEQVNCKWYEVTDQINYLPGGVVKGEVSYVCGFYDLADGLQTHSFAPAGVDLKGLWKIRGNMPGEPPEPPELGVDVPKSGLYLREDVEVRCSVFVMGFVVRNIKKSHGQLVQTWLAKAHAAEARKQQQSQSTSLTGTDTSQPQSVTSHQRARPNGVGSASSNISQCSRTSDHSTPQIQREHQKYAPYKAIQPQSQSPSSVAHSTTTVAAPRRPSESFGFGKPLPPDPPTSQGPLRYRSPQLYGEQAELPTTTQYTVDEDNWPDAPPMENLSGPRDAANGKVLELDNSEVAYWKQQPT